MTNKELYYNASKDECDRAEHLERAMNYISDLVDHISELEQTQKELIEYLRLEHQGSSLQDEWVYCHEVDRCNTCKLIKSIVGEWNEKA